MMVEKDEEKERKEIKESFLLPVIPFTRPPPKKAMRSGLSIAETTAIAVPAAGANY